MPSRSVSLLALALLFSGPARADDAPPRAITAKGEGKVEVTPDAARIHVGVEVEEATLGEARRKNERAFQKVLQQVQQLKLTGLLMKSDQARVDIIREDSPGRGKLARVIGYRIYNSITIRVNDPNPNSLSQKAAKVVDQVLAAGANQLHGVTFLRLESRSAYNQALRYAIDDAKLNASMIAGQARVGLGPLRSLTPGWGHHYPELAYSPGGRGWGESHGYTQSAGVPGGSGMAVTAGTFLVKASVTAVFDIK